MSSPSTSPAVLPWKKDHAWSRRFLPEMKRIIGEYLIVEAPQEEDISHNTDLIVLRLDAIRIACRVRKHHYVHRFGDEFTIRSDRPNSVKTELAKIIEGWGDYILYGFADAPERALCAWVLGDLRVFRLWFNSSIVKHSGHVPGSVQPNRDGSSDFRAFRISDLPATFVIARCEREKSDEQLELRWD
jgi:hypothetical protein